MCFPKTVTRLKIQSEFIANFEYLFIVIMSKCQEPIWESTQLLDWTISGMLKYTIGDSSRLSFEVELNGCWVLVGTCAIGRWEGVWFNISFGILIKLSDSGTLSC